MRNGGHYDVNTNIVCTLTSNKVYCQLPLSEYAKSSRKPRCEFPLFSPNIWTAEIHQYSFRVSFLYGNNNQEENPRYQRDERDFLRKYDNF